MTRTRNMPRYETTVSFHWHFLFLVKISLLKYWPKFRISNFGQKLAFSIEICHFLPKFRNFSAKMTNFWSKFLFVIGQFCVLVENGEKWSFLDRNWRKWPIFDRNLSFLLDSFVFFGQKWRFQANFESKLPINNWKWFIFGQKWVSKIRAKNVKIEPFFCRMEVFGVFWHFE